MPAAVIYHIFMQNRQGQKPELSWLRFLTSRENRLNRARPDCWLANANRSFIFDREVTLLASHYIQDTRKNLAEPRSFASHSTHQKEYQLTRRKTFVSPITPMGDSLPHSKNSSCGCSLICNEQRKAIFIV